MISNLIAKFATQLIVAAVLAVIVGGGFIGLKLHYTNVGDVRGYQRAINEIAANNKEAIDAADQARRRVRDCWNAGRVWDSTEQDGVCR
jgi:hypothetical protein